jgi:glyoxalase family protein
MFFKIIISKQKFLFAFHSDSWYNYLELVIIKINNLGEITMAKSIKGIHHVTAITDDIVRNYEFFTEILGMRLVKKTINQDEIQTYHTYYADHIGTPGTGMTFFGNPNSPQGTHGTDSITRTGLRVPNDEALDYYLNRFKDFDVKHDGIQEVFGKKVLQFEEPDGQRYQLVSDENNEGMEAGKAWDLSPVPNEFVVYGLGPVEITVSEYEVIKDHFIDFYGFEIVKEEKGGALLEIGEGGNGAQIILKEDTESTTAMQGNGEVHHLALRVDNREALKAWEELYEKNNLNHSGFIERHYFGALYVRVGRVLVELSSDDPGFTIDEPYETLGESLALPAEFEDRREYIENQIRPFDTTVDRT